MARNGVRNVNLPTNGLLPERLFPAMDRMLERCPETSIDLNFSLDGLARTHDSIRGVPHNFERTLGCMAEAEKRYRGIRRLRRNVLTVITRENQAEIVPLAEYLREHGRNRRPILRNRSRAGARPVAEDVSPGMPWRLLCTGG